MPLTNPQHEDAIQNHGNINPEDHPNDVIELHNDNEEGQRLKITWYELGPGGKINRIVVNPEQVRSRLRGTWGRLPEVSVVFSDLKVA